MAGLLVTGFSCAMSWCDLDLIFDLGKVNIEILPWLYLRNHKV